MARRNPPARWPLPEVVDPAGRRCIQVPVPDDPAHIAAFRGAMLALQSAYNWADDPTHKARDVALVWRAIIDGMTTWGCDMAAQTILRKNPEGCGVDWSLDDGAHWTTIDLAECIGMISADQFAALFPDAYAAALAQSIADGVIPLNGQQGSPQAAIDPGGCKDFHVVMQARENWICPIPVGVGSSIRVSDASGGWNDGTVQWYCWDGNGYGLGMCTPDSAHFEETDPLTTAHHMTVVGRLLTSGDWFDPVSSTWEVPAGKPDQLFVLQANDQSLSDNYGEIQFDVHVCTGGWTHVFSGASLADWTIPPGGYDAQWDGTAWQPRNGQMYVLKNLPVLTGQTYLWYRITGYSDNGYGARIYDHPDWTGNQIGNGMEGGLPSGSTGGTILLSWTGSYPNVRNVSEVVVAGTGTDPF